MADFSDWTKTLHPLIWVRLWVLPSTLMLSEPERTELSSPPAAGSPSRGWGPWWWREAYGASERGDAAGGPGGSSLLSPGSPWASHWVFWSGWSRRWWGAGPSQRGSDAWTGCNPRPSPPPCIRPGSADASSPRPQLQERQPDTKNTIYKEISDTKQDFLDYLCT